MKNSKNPITGVIKTDNIDYSFHLSEYCMLLLDNVVNSYTRSTLKPVDGFAQAMTHSGSKILMHVGSRDFTVASTMKINLSSYIVSTTNVLDYNISYFEGIEFVGGTLLNLKMPQGMKINYDSEMEKRYIEHVDDTQTFSFSTDEFECKVTIGSYTNEHQGLTGAIKNLQNEVAKLRSDINRFEDQEAADKAIDKSDGSLYVETMPNGSSRVICGFCWEEKSIRSPLVPTWYYGDHEEHQMCTCSIAMDFLVIYSDNISNQSD